MHLSNWRDNRSYNIEKYVYKNNVSNIWCGIGSDSKRHKVFVKILNYGNFLDASMTLDFVNAFEQEAITLKRVSECSNAVPKLYDSWNDRKNKKYIIVMKMVPGISLRKWLDTHKKNELQAKDIFVRKCIIIQLCEIIHFLRREMLDFTAFPVFFVSNLLLVQRKKYYFNRATVSRNCSIVL